MLVWILIFRTRAPGPVRGPQRYRAHGHGHTHRRSATLLLPSALSSYPSPVFQPGRGTRGQCTLLLTVSQAPQQCSS